MSESIMPKKLTGHKVFFIFFAFFAFVAGVNAIFITNALRTHAGVVESRTYERGLDYNARLKRAKAENILGWQERFVHKDDLLIWEIKDKHGLAIEDAFIMARIVRPVQKGYDFDVILEETDPGIYRAEIKPPLPGLWEVRAKATWQNQTYHSFLEINAP